MMRAVQCLVLLFCAVALTNGARAETAQDTEDNMQIVREMVRQIQNEHRLDQVDRFFANDFVNHTAQPGSPNDRESMRALFSAVTAAFPESKVTILDQTASGSRVWTYKRFTGTHTAPFYGVAPTGRVVTYEVMDILEIENGKITAHWAVVDQLGLLRQLGVTESPSSD